MPKKKTPCQEHRRMLDKYSTDLKEIKSKLTKIDHLLTGNGKAGVVEMSRRAFEAVNKTQNTWDRLFVWSCRIVITVLISYVAVKVGLK